jgi:hypothetical protein
VPGTRATRLAEGAAETDVVRRLFGSLLFHRLLGRSATPDRSTCPEAMI